MLLVSMFTKYNLRLRLGHCLLMTQQTRGFVNKVNK